MLDFYNMMLEKYNNLLLKNNNKKQIIILWFCTYIVLITVIFITIGLFFPNDFSFFGIPGLGVIHYILILFLFSAVGFWYKTKKKNYY